MSHEGAPIQAAHIILSCIHDWEERELRGRSLVPLDDSRPRPCIRNHVRTPFAHDSFGGVEQTPLEKVAFPFSPLSEQQATVGVCPLNHLSEAP